PVLLGLLFALIVDRRIFQLVLEEALVGVPAFALGFVSQQGEIEAFNRFRAFLGQLGADALLFLQPGDVVAAGAAVKADQVLALVLQARIVHVGGILISRAGALAGHHIAGDIARFVLGEAQTGHGGHLLDLQLVAIVGTLTVLQIEHEGQVVFLVVFFGEVLLLEGAVRQRALARIVDPADQVFVVGLLALAAQVG